MTDPGTTLGDVIHRRGGATWRRFSALEHLREGYARDDRETLQGAAERTP